MRSVLQNSANKWRPCFPNTIFSYSLQQYHREHHQYEDDDDIPAPSSRQQFTKPRKKFIQKPEPLPYTWQKVYYEELPMIQLSSNVPNPKEVELGIADANCPGCGSPFQLEDANKQGYVDIRTIEKQVKEKQEYEKILEKIAKIREKKVEDDFIEMEEFKLLEKVEKTKYSKVLICQRCHQLANYGTEHAPQLKSQHKIAPLEDILPEDFTPKLKKLLENDKHALVIKVIDIFDLENSYIPNLQEILTPKNKIVIAVNKIDLLPKRISLVRLENYIRRFTKQVYGQHIEIEQLCFVSAKNGVGIKQLAATMEKVRAGENVYVVGSTNVGKSTLINMMMESVNPDVSLLEKAVEVKQEQKIKSKQVQEAKDNEEEIKAEQQQETEQPIQEETSVSEKTEEEVEKEKQIENEKKMRKIVSEYLSIIDGDLRRFTPHLTTSAKPGTTLSTISFVLHNRKSEKVYINTPGVKDIVKKKNAFLFDTPGVINPHLVSNYLNVKELKYAYPHRKIVPRHFRLRPGRSLFIGGLVRIDYDWNKVNREDWDRVMITAFCSSHIPFHGTSIEKADSVYEKHLGHLLYPPGNPELSKDPKTGEFVQTSIQDPKHQQLTPLDNKQVYQLEGESRLKAICDFAFSGYGWIAVTGVGHMQLTIHVPKVMDVFVREEALAPYETYKLTKDEFKDV